MCGICGFIKISNSARFIDHQYLEDMNNQIAVDITDIDFKVDDVVNIEYQGAKSIGKVVRIYNNGETVNVKWDGKQTAFYYKNVSKVK